VITLTKARQHLQSEGLIPCPMLGDGLAASCWSLFSAVIFSTLAAQLQTSVQVLSAAGMPLLQPFLAG
jgi:hypothetical protein